MSEEDTYKNLEQMSPLPSDTGFTETMKIGAIMCLKKDDELWDPFVVVSINHSNSSIKVIMPHMKYDGVRVLFGEDRSTQLGDFASYEFIEKHDIEYVAVDIFIESDEGEYYVEDTNYQIVFLQDLDGVIQRPLSILT